ncbi:MAG: LptE family protein [Cyclobacteriaceae bacterium]|nr:LptE family protein [Cyclobacteriaceae bacterium]
MNYTVNRINLKTTCSLVVFLTLVSGCGLKYSLSGAATTAKTIQVDLFYNNTDLGPANLGQSFTNKLKDYYQRNSSLKVVQENGELLIEGTLIQYAVAPLAPVAGSSAAQPSQAALTRLTIGVKANYVDTKEPKNSFKDKTFSFYADFPNEENLISIQESLENKIFDQIFLDIFNATLANW